MLPTVPVQPSGLERSREPAGDEAVERLRTAAAPLVGARVLHLNSTAFGGGVAELLFTHVGLLQDLGIDTTWQVLEGADDFFTVTKFVHNGMQGADVPWTDDMARIYFDRVRANAEQIDDSYDYVFIHDPQPVADVLHRYGVDPSRPVVTQISRFDPWKDPIGVIDAFRLARMESPGLQLVMVGSMAHDDPEGWHYLQATQDHRENDPDIH